MNEKEEDNPDYTANKEMLAETTFSTSFEPPTSQDSRRYAHGYGSEGNNSRRVLGREARMRRQLRWRLNRFTFIK
jgi:hypothetical protein